MNHIWCFVIDVLVEMIVKKLWRALTSRAAAWMDHVTAEVFEMMGLDRAAKWLAGGLALALCFAGGGIYMWACRSKAKAA